MGREQYPPHARSLISVLACLAPGVADAHSFGTPYVPPIPLWMYVYGGAATLIVTFAIMGLFVSAPAHRSTTDAAAATRPMKFRLSRRTLGVLRGGALGVLLLTIVAGLIGTQDPAHNVSMTLFWVIFLLAFAYLIFVAGDLYPLISPWRWLVNIFERTGLDLSKPRLPYPPCLAYWPALVLYAALIWLELFIAATPKALSTALLLYSASTFLAVALFGKAIWFERGDPFSVFFRLIGILAPVEYHPAAARRSWLPHLRRPFAGAVTERPDHVSLVVFMLLVLAATSYDAIHETTIWVGLYWKNLLQLLQPLWGEDLGKAQEMLMGGYLVYRQVGLVVFPFLYLALYWLALWGAKAFTGTTLPTRALALSFCYSLLPIAIAYHFTHYFPFLVAEAGNLLPRLSDPFGFGWNLFGIEPRGEPSPLKMSFIWHTQVVVLLLGHIVSVSLAHCIALRVFPTRRQAIMSQLPLLSLMVAYTIFGLWILSLPLAE